MTAEVFGGSYAVKALSDNRFEAIAIKFHDAPDCVNDVFDYLDEEALGLNDGKKWWPLHFQHGGDEKVKGKRLAKASFEIDPFVGVKIRWSFENPYDPDVANIKSLCHSGCLAISSAGHPAERVQMKDYRLITRWPVVEVSLTNRACAISGATRVGGAKGLRSLSLAEMLLRHKSEELRHQTEAILSGECGSACACRCSRPKSAAQLRYESNLIGREARRLIRFGTGSGPGSA